MPAVSPLDPPMQPALSSKCPSCGKNEYADDHTCPFQEDVNEDHEFLCNCCSECEQRCADDI